MSICYAGHRREDLPVESRLLEEVTVRLVAREAERQRHDELLEREHYLGNATVVGRVLRYAAEHRGKSVAVLTFCWAALHLKPRDRFLKGSARQVKERRHLLAQSCNLGSRVDMRQPRGRSDKRVSLVRIVGKVDTEKGAAHGRPVASRPHAAAVAREPSPELQDCPKGSCKNKFRGRGVMIAISE